MVVQAGAAEEMLAHDPAKAVEPLAAIRQTGKNALGEMRRLLGVLRADPDSPTLAPQPGLGDLPELVEQMRGAGLDVRLGPLDELPSLPPGPDLVAYRIVQEALTNTLKHAGKVESAIAVEVRGQRLAIDVSDTGTAARPNGSAGHGLIGMRERLRVHGGELDAGPQPGGGFLVVARLPLEPEKAGVP